MTTLKEWKNHEIHIVERNTLWIPSPSKVRHLLLFWQILIHQWVHGQESSTPSFFELKFNNLIKLYTTRLDTHLFCYRVAKSSAVTSMSFDMFAEYVIQWSKPFDRTSFAQKVDLYLLSVWGFGRREGIGTGFPFSIIRQRSSPTFSIFSPPSS